MPLLQSWYRKSLAQLLVLRATYLRKLALERMSAPWPMPSLYRRRPCIAALPPPPPPKSVGPGVAAAAAAAAAAARKNEKTMLASRIELETSCLQDRCSTTKLSQLTLQRPVQYRRIGGEIIRRRRSESK